jgi:hypothetical protein
VRTVYICHATHFKQAAALAFFVMTCVCPFLYPSGTLPVGFFKIRYCELITDSNQIYGPPFRFHQRTVAVSSHDHINKLTLRLSSVSLVGKLVLNK